MDIEIKNEDNVISICNRVLNSDVAQMQNYIATLNNMLNKINLKWSSNGLDKESYVLELKKQNNNLETIKGAIVQLYGSILAYAENIKQTSSKKVGSTGNNITKIHSTTSQLSSRDNYISDHKTVRTAPQKEISPVNTPDKTSTKSETQDTKSATQPADNPSTTPIMAKEINASSEKSTINSSKINSATMDAGSITSRLSTINASNMASTTAEPPKMTLDTKS